MNNGLASSGPVSSVSDDRTASTSEAGSGTGTSERSGDEQLAHALAELVRSEIQKLGGSSLLEHIDVSRIEPGSYLGQGAFGRVFRGTFKDTGETLAIKQIPGTVFCDF